MRSGSGGSNIYRLNVQKQIPEKPEDEVVMQKVYLRNQFIFMTAKNSNKNQHE